MRLGRVISWKRVSGASTLSTRRSIERVDLLCVRLIGEGRKRYAVDAFFNQLRWHASASMDPPEPWKMNDHYRPYYARFWLQNNEAHWGFFELRRVKGEYPYEEWAVELE